MAKSGQEPASSGLYYLGSKAAEQDVPAVTGLSADAEAHQRNVSPAPGVAVTLTGIRIREQGRRTAGADCSSLHIRAGQSVALYDRADDSAIELLDVVAGRRRHRNGQVTVRGIGHRMGAASLDRPQRERSLQSRRFSLLQSRSVSGNLLAALRTRRNDAAARARIAELLVITGAADLAARRVDTLSAEQLWRVLVARALLINAQLVLAEDPAPDLDSRAASRALDLLMDAQSRFGFTLLLATGHLGTAARCERVVSLVDGQVTGDELLGDDAWTRVRIDRIG